MSDMQRAMMMSWDEQSRALNILHNMAMESQRPWWAFWRPRFCIHHEPLRHDAASLLRRVGYQAAQPMGARYVTDAEPCTRTEGC